MFFAASWDRTTWSWTLIVVVGLLTLMGFCYTRLVYVAAQGYGASWRMIFTIAVCILAIVGGTTVTPLGYRVESDRFVIRRLVGAHAIRFADIASVEPAPYEQVFVPGTWRKFGVGGPFGLLGYFKNGSIGTFVAYVTNRRKLVLVRMKTGRPVVVSPNNPEEFVGYVAKQRSLSLH